VPALAAVAGGATCSHHAVYDPCEQTTYVQAACDSAVAHQGYYYGGTWYPHVYPYAALYYTVGIQDSSRAADACAPSRRRSMCRIRRHRRRGPASCEAVSGASARATASRAA